jgi:predicted signal transduction protein with EAL and GGDEF domain
MMENEKYHRLNKDPIVLSGFNRTLPEIEWLLLVLILLSDYLALKAQQVAKRIIERFNDSNVRYQGNKIILSASFGVAAFSEHGHTLDEVIQCADMAMYSSKQRGSNLITPYEENLQAVG